MTQQGDRQATVRAATGTALDYNGDWHALFDQASIPAGPFDGRLLAWLGVQLSQTFTNINDAMQAYAESQSATNWDSMGAFTIGNVTAPSNTGAPIVSGSTVEGQTLTSSQGTWANNPTGFAYVWKRSGTPIVGATASTYLLVSADVGSTLTCTVTASNSAGSAAASSSATATITAAPPVNTVAPSISGIQTKGQVLTTSSGTWTGSPTFAYAWKRAGSAISGATSSTYTLVTADVGQVITCTVTGTNSGGSVGATSNATGAIADTLTISGTPVTTGMVGTAYTGFSAVAAGGHTTYVYSVHAGALPAGITLNAATGAVSGNPTTAGTQSGIVIRVTDADGLTADLASFAIVVSRLWIPTDLGATLVQWMDGADGATITTVSGNVSAWSDKSGKGNNASQATAGSRPALTANALNSLSALTFAGGIKTLTHASILTSDYTATYMLKPTESGVNGVYYQHAGDVADGNLGLYAEASVIAGGFGNFSQGGNLNASAEFPSSLVWKTQVHQPAKLFKDGTEVTYSAFNTPAPGGALTAIGGEPTFFFVGQLAEAVICDTVLIDANRQKVEGYLAWKWGLAANLPSGHPYKSGPPTV